MTRHHVRRISTSLAGHVLHTHRKHNKPARPSPEHHEAIQRQSELEEDLRLARDLQQGLLLEAAPRVPGWELSAVSLPARELGGDLYDFVPLKDGAQGIMIGDVSGKGLPAALRMAVARTLFRQEARRSSAPGATLSWVNQMLIEELPHGMVTMLYVAIDIASGRVLLANAGHNYPVIVNGAVQELELSGVPLGVLDGEEYSEEVTSLDYGDTLMLLTDGVVEATSPSGELFGFDRLRVLLHNNMMLKPRALLALILAEIRAWSGGRAQADDVTMVIIRRRLRTLGEEIRSAADDVLGPDQAEVLWSNVNLPPLDAPIEEWYTGLKRLTEAIQAQAGRGLAREMQQHIRLLIDEYRALGDSSSPAPS